LPRYFFHLRDSSEFIDHEGVDLPSIDEARAQAVVAAGEALRDLDGRFWQSGEWRMWVTNENGATVFTLKFSAE
jgi:hypothetical protein